VDFQGTDHNAFSSGSGALGHNRAYLGWIKRIFDRYPSLVIETCSSGGQRLDYAMLAMHPIQSTSDQQDAVRFAAVSTNIPTAITPEQSAAWAYPQPDWADEKIALTMVNTLLGRVHLSGRIDLLSKSQLQLVKDGMDVYKQIRQDIKSSVPFWPLGLSKWHDEWLALGLKAKDCLYLAVWRRGGKLSCPMALRHITKNTQVTIKLLYPATFEAKTSWDARKGELEVTLPESVCARLFKISI
jgi:alpha-galactosidase